MTRVMFAMYLLCSEACCRPEGDNSGKESINSPPYLGGTSDHPPCIHLGSTPGNLFPPPHRSLGRGGGGGRPRSRDFSPEMRWLAPAHAIGWRLAIVIVLNAFALTLPLTAVDLYVVRA